MAKTFERTKGQRFGDRMMAIFIRIGWIPEPSYVLTVRGRKTGRSYSNPVTLVVEGGQRWLVAVSGESSWVKNARAAGLVTLARARKSETVAITELGPEECAPVLKLYLTRAAITQRYFDATPDSPVEAFAAEAARHPVFLIQDKN